LDLLRGYHRQSAAASAAADRSAAQYDTTPVLSLDRAVALIMASLAERARGIQPGGVVRRRAPRQWRGEAAPGPLG